MFRVTRITLLFVKCVYLQVLEYFRVTEQVIDDL